MVDLNELGRKYDPLGNKFGLYGNEPMTTGAAYGSNNAADRAAYEQELAKYNALPEGMKAFVQPPQPPQGFDEANFQLGTANTDQYGLGGVAGTYTNRQIDPATQQMLMQQATGAAPSAAQQMMQESLRRNQAQAMGMSVGNANLAPAQAMRMALNAQTQMGLQSQSQFGAMRAQEQAQGQQMLANWMQSQQSQNDEMVRYYQSLGYTMDEAQLKAGMALEMGKFGAYEAEQNRSLSAQGANIGAQQNQQNAMMAMGGTVVGGMVGGPAGASAGGAIAGGASGGGSAPTATSAAGSI